MNNRLRNTQSPSTLYKRIPILFILGFAMLFPTPNSARGLPDHAINHDKKGYDISFTTNGTFTAECRCVAIDPSVSMCVKLLRALVAIKTNDLKSGIHE